jgi:hypothetical protein
MFVRVEMKVFIKVVFFVFAISIPFLFSSCSKSGESSESMVLSQHDIDLLVQHKKNIDRITEKYDKILSKTKKQDQQKILKKGKAEINSYLKSQDLNPLFFMRKSKKILEGYIAFYKTSEKALKRRKKMLREQNLSEKEIEMNINAFKNERERIFKELTSNLSDYEIELIRSNLEKLSSVINL